jgi:shikimate dehydrogenase
MASSPDRYAVIGNPIAHSRSPDIHTMFAQATGQHIEYTRCLAPRGGFRATLEDLVRQGFRGANVTVPFKQEAFALARSRSTRAQAAQAANTLCFDAGTLHADNTDGIGLLRDLEERHGLALDGARILLLGAGGAARGVAQPLLDAKPSSLVIANRTLAAAQQIETELHGLDPGVAVRAVALTSIPLEPFDLVVNATSASLAPTDLPIPDACIGEHTFVYDMVYGAHDTAFMAAARRRGAKVADGLGMLVEQAAEAFLLWRGVRPDTRDVYVALRAAMSAALPP